MDVQFFIGLVIFVAMGVVIVKVRQRRLRDKPKVDRDPPGEVEPIDPSLLEKLKEIFKGHRFP